MWPRDGRRCCARAPLVRPRLHAAWEMARSTRSAGRRRAASPAAREQVDQRLLVVWMYCAETLIDEHQRLVRGGGSATRRMHEAQCLRTGGWSPPRAAPGAAAPRVAASRALASAPISAISAHASMAPKGRRRWAS